MYDKKEICKDMNFITKRNRDIQKRGEQGWVQEYMFASKKCASIDKRVL